MHLFRAFSLIIAVIVSSPAYSFEVYSIEPVDPAPGSVIQITGNQFEDGSEVLIGALSLRPNELNPSRISVSLPQTLTPGIYRVTVLSRKRLAYPLSITVKQAVANTVVHNYSPDIIDSCTERATLTIQGENLNSVVKISVNGTVVKPSLSSDTQIGIEISRRMIEGRNQGLSVLLYDKGQKLITSLPIRIDKSPAINTANVINSSVNSYEMRISGKNFSKGARLYVNGQPIASQNEQDGILPSRPSLARLSPTSPVNDRFSVISCNEISYIRYPMTSDDRKLGVSVQNPDGETSDTFPVTAP